MSRSGRRRSAGRGCTGSWHGDRVYKRDPLSPAYDGYVRQVMLRAIRAERQREGIYVWIASHPREGVDARGLTVHERAFQRSCYYLMWRAYIKRDRVPPYALKMTWGEETRPSSGGRYARRATIRLWLRSQARVTKPRWTDDPGGQSYADESGRHVVPPPR